MLKAKLLAFISVAALSLSTVANGQPLPPPGGGSISLSGQNGIGCTPNPVTGTGICYGSEVLGNSGAPITGTSYAVSLTNDLGTELVFTGSSASAWTTGAGAGGNGFDIVNQGSANVTDTFTGNIVSCSGSTCASAATLVVAPGTYANVFYDAINSTWRASLSQIGGSGGTVINSVNHIPSWWFANSPLATAGTHQNANTVWYSPTFLPKAVTLANLGAYVNTPDAGGNVQFQIYANSSSNGPTGAPLCPANASQSTTTATWISSPCAVSLTAGWYWCATNQDNSTSALVSIPDTTSSISYSIGADTEAHLWSSGSVFNTQITTSATFGTWGTNPTITRAVASFSETPVCSLNINTMP